MSPSLFLHQNENPRLAASPGNGELQDFICVELVQPTPSLKDAGEVKKRKPGSQLKPF